MRRALGGLALMIALLGSADRPAHAADAYPARPIEVIVPATPGGPVDTALRLITPGLAGALGQALVVINRPGASGTLGMHTLAKAEPDGYTIGVGVNSIFTVTRVSGTEVPFTLDDFTLLGDFVTDVSVLAVRPDARWTSLDALLADAKAAPGKLTFASAGAGTVSSLSMQALLEHFAVDMTGVPYPGGAQLTTALLGGTVDVGMVPLSTGAALFRSGKLRPLATTAPHRLAAFEDLPTLAEKGVTAQGLNLVMGLYAPRGLPPAVKDKLTGALQKAAADPQARAKFDALGLIAAYEDPAAARRRLETEYASVVQLSSTLRH